MNRVCEVLGINKPVVQAPMLWITSPELVAAVSNAGGLGVLGFNAGTTVRRDTAEETAADMRDAIRRTKELTDKPFGIDIVPASADAGGYSTGIVDVMREENVKIMVLAGESFEESDVVPFKEEGFTIIARQLNPTIRDAKRLEAWGVDIIVATGCDEGGCMPCGSTGTMAQVALLSDAVSIPVLAAGGIINEKFARASAILGAEGAFAGTRFTLSKECRAAEATKQNLLETPQDDFVVFTQWDGTSKWRSTPNPVVLAAAEANRQGNRRKDPCERRYCLSRALSSAETFSRLTRAPFPKRSTQHAGSKIGTPSSTG
jgi:enoyl-[acyl-carrier protein] reductase II